MKTTTATITLTADIMETLSNASMDSFYHETPYRFKEVTRSENAPSLDTVTSQGNLRLYWGDHPVLHSLFVQALANLGHRVWWLEDEANYDEWCILTDWQGPNQTNFKRKAGLN